VSRRVATDRFAPQRVVDLGEGVRRLTAPNPGLMTGPGTNTYLVGEESVTVVDPGPDHPAHVRAIVRAAGRRRIAWIVLTHTHPDHWPAARRLLHLTDAQLAAAPGAPREDAFDLRRDHVVRDAHPVGGGDGTLRAIHTPGHAPNHVCLVHRGSGSLVSGDHVLDGTTTVVSPSRGGDMDAYLRSLRRLRRLRSVRRILPAHGDVIADPHAKLTEYIEHRGLRERQILRLLRRGPMTPAQLVAAIYVDSPAGRPGGLPEGLVEMARRQMHAHLLKLRGDGRVVGRSIDARWTRV
jgi:glyoxylase-like metal-dependent hydrolase (beta-lactamase superfamily II)